MLNTSPPIAGSVQARRLAARLTQTELAIAADCSLSSVQMFCNGYVPKSSPALDRVNAVLDEALAEAKS
jgi:hypothetical protein